MLKCSKCGAENKDTSKFCCECGTKLEIPQEEKHPVETSETKPTVKKTVLGKIRDILIPAAVLLFTVLIFVSMFMPAVSTVEGGVILDSKGPQFLLSEVFSLLSADSNDMYFLLVLIVSFYVGLILITIFGIISIVKAIKDLSHKKGITCFKPFCSMLIASLQYFVIFYFGYGVSWVGGDAAVKYGAGAILAIVILILTILLKTFIQVVDFIEKKEQSLKTIIVKSISLILLALFLLIGFGPFITIPNGTVFYPLSYCLNMNFNEQVKAFMIPVSIVAFAVQLILLFTTTGNLNKNIRSDSKTLTIGQAIGTMILSYLVCFFAGFIFSMPTTTTVNPDTSDFLKLFTQILTSTKYGPGAIACSVLPVLMLASAIVQQIFINQDKKKKEK